MKRILPLVVGVAMLGAAFSATAATNTATLTVTGSIIGSLTVTLSSTGFTALSGTAAPVVAFGNISRYGTTPTG